MTKQNPHSMGLNVCDPSYFASGDQPVIYVCANGPQRHSKFSQAKLRPAEQDPVKDSEGG